MKRRQFLVLSSQAALLLGGAGRGLATLPACEWCGAADAPPNPGTSAALFPPDEPGERLLLHGTVYAADGRTPASGVLLYAYNTNAAGNYPVRDGASGNARRHGYLRGWVVSGADGGYRFHTIRPAAYPTRAEPAHIHMTATAPRGTEYWLDDVLFEGDPLITPKILARRSGRGGPAIVPLRRSGDGVLVARRDVILAAPEA